MTSSPKNALRGARKPRVCNYPAYGTSAGREAVELARSVGLVLDPWQADVLEHSLGEDVTGKWTAFEVGVIVARQNGKGSILEARELAGLLLFGEKLIMHTAHEMKTSLEAFRRVEALFDSSHDMRRRVKRVSHQNGEEGIELRDGARLRFVARSKGSGRGFSGDLVILDEAYAVTTEQIDALMPTMSARPNPQIWYTSSPPLDATSGAQLFAVRRRGEAGGDGLAWFDWGAEGCLDDLSSVDLDDRKLWAATNPAYGHRVSEWFIEKERAALSPSGFARERLGIWPPDLSQGFQVIPGPDWAAALDEHSKADGKVAFAVDVSWDRTRASIAAAGRRADGMHHIEVVQTGAGTGWIVDRIRQLAAKWNPVAVVVDQGSPAGSLIPDLEAAGVDITKVGAPDVAKAFGAFYDGVSGQDPAGRTIRHLGQAELDAAVAGATRRPVGDGFAWDRRTATVDLTPLVAVTNALYGFALKGHVMAYALVEWGS